MMKRAPDITIQLIHIEGPLKGEVQEFSDAEITIGRNPSCHVTFPKDQMVISRVHAKISREGNRFKITDQSANGTLVNGKFVTETQFLKDGDVIFITEQGPKISFLTQPGLAAGTGTSNEPLPEPNRAPLSEPDHLIPPEKPEIRVQETAVQLVVQYGPNLQSFKKMPVTAGQSPEADLKLTEASISGRHAQFFFHDHHYWVKDLTGEHIIQVNGMPIQNEQQLNTDDRICLSPDGPTFQFIGGGRLIEMETPVQPDVNEALAPADSSDKNNLEQTTGEKKKKKNIFKRFF